MKYIIKDFLHRSLICCFNILKSEGHHLVTVNSFRGSKGSELLILGCHPNLVASQWTVHEWQCFVTNSRVYHKLCIWQWELILGACLVQISKIDTKSNLSSLHFDWDNIRDLFWKLYFSNESILLKFVNFSLNLGKEFWSKQRWAIGRTSCFIAN